MPTPADDPDIDFSTQPFEQIYAAVGADLSALPWSKLPPRGRTDGLVAVQWITAAQSADADVAGTELGGVPGDLPASRD